MDITKKYNINAPQISAFEAAILCVHYAAMACTYWEVASEDNVIAQKRLLAGIANLPEVQRHAIEALINFLEDSYSKM